jgi:hypothetical protein
MMSEKPDDSAWDGSFSPCFASILKDHLSRYRMASQTVTHLSVAGGATSSAHERPAIELF